MKTNDLNQMKAAGLHKVTLMASGTGASEKDCMSKALYDDLVERNVLQGTVFVCGQGWSSGGSTVYGYYKYNYEYEYDYEYKEEYNYDYKYYNSDNNDHNNQGGTVGGSAPSGPAIPNPDKQPGTHTNCSEKARNKAKMTQSIIDTPYVSIKTTGDPFTISEDAYMKMQYLRSTAGSFSVENSFAINYRSKDDYYLPYKDPNTGIIFNQGTKNRAKIVFDVNTTYIAHTHPTGTNAAPSGIDVRAVIDTVKKQLESIYEGKDKDGKPLNENDFKLLQGSLITSANGMEYLISVDNVGKIKGLLMDPDIAFFLSEEVPVDGTFTEGTKWKRTYDEVYQKLKADKYSDNDAQAHAIAYVIENYDMGLTIMKRDNKTGDFNELRTTKNSSEKYIPTKCKE